MYENGLNKRLLSKKKIPGLYIHVPFCPQKCPYCDFYSTTSLALVYDWLHAFKKEADVYKDKFDSFDSLYIGGGTPTCLKVSELTALIDCVLRCFHFSDNAEITIEANPDDITLEKLRLLQRLGVNRISLGVQSFDDNELQYLRRRHTALQAERALESIRACGFTNVGVDLMYGFEGHTEDGWTKTLKRALDFRPEHIACYEMTLEKATPFGEMLAEGKIKPLGEEQGRAFFLLTSRFLVKHGYLHYEISNFSRGERYKCRHNRKYWQHAPYLGLGPSAHSFREDIRWWNVRSVKDYCQMLADGKTPVAGTETLSLEQHRLESLYLGFRTSDGIDIELVRNGAQTGMIVGKLEESGLVRVHEGRVIPTTEGFLVADSLPLLFYD